MRFRGRHERNERSILFVARLEMVGHKVADCGAGTLKFRLGSQVYDENVHSLLLGTGVRAQSLIAMDVPLEGVLDILSGPLLRLGFI